MSKMANKLFSLFKRKIQFQDWDKYKAKIDFLDVFHWQQSVRRENLRR